MTWPVIEKHHPKSRQGFKFAALAWVDGEIVLEALKEIKLYNEDTIEVDENGMDIYERSGELQ